MDLPPPSLTLCAKGFYSGYLLARDPIDGGEGIVSSEAPSLPCRHYRRRPCRRIAGRHLRVIAVRSVLAALGALSRKTVSFLQPISCCHSAMAHFDSASFRYIELFSLMDLRRPRHFQFHQIAGAAVCDEMRLSYARSDGLLCGGESKYGRNTARKFLRVLC